MKSILGVLLLLSLAGCSQSSSGGGGTSASIDYASCEALPSETVMEQNPCPGAAGTWNNYEVKKDSSGTVTSFKLWCGGTDGDHPADQVSYDSYMVPVGSTSNEDFKSGSDCVSGSSDDASSDRTVNIWQLVK